MRNAVHVDFQLPESARHFGKAAQRGRVLFRHRMSAEKLVHDCDVGPHDGKFRRVPPVLAVEIQGELEDEESLRTKARWYLVHGVEVVWLLFPMDLRVTVLTNRAEHVATVGDSLPPHPALPELAPPVDELFAQVKADRGQ